MKLICASLCFVFVFISFLSDAHSESVRVRLQSFQKSVSVSGLLLKFQSSSRAYQLVSIPRFHQAEVRLLEKEGKKFWAVRLNNQDPERIITDSFLLVQGEGLRIGAMKVPAKVLLSHSDNGRIDVIGVLPLEDYLVGVLASEMPLSWPLETLKAQAIAARSYALSVMQERKNKAYHLESSILDQVYNPHLLDARKSGIKKAIQAVRETQGVKLVDSRNRVLKAFFHSDCGGKTTAPHNVWNYGVNAGTTTDTSCPANTKAQWKLVLSKDEVKRRLGIADFSYFDLVKIPTEKRIKMVRVALNENKSVTFAVNDFRQKMGFQDLKSALFEVKTVEGSIIFQGQGNGHGVGLCQWGSRSLGIQGKSYTEILHHYYPLAKIL